MKFTIDECLAKLPLPANDKRKNGVWDTEPNKTGEVALVLCAPERDDFQTFHEENEYYFIARGSGELVLDDERFEFEAEDAFFVPAKILHRFENFTVDFATWAIFF